MAYRLSGSELSDRAPKLILGCRPGRAPQAGSPEAPHAEEPASPTSAGIPSVRSWTSLPHPPSQDGQPAPHAAAGAGEEAPHRAAQQPSPRPPLRIDVEATQRAVRRLNVHVDVHSYVSRFGVVSSGAPFGDNVWHGMSMLFNDLLMFRSHRSSPSRFGAPGPWAAGWFIPPRPFGSDNAMLPVDALPEGEPYPAFVFFDADGWVYMWCLAILIQYSRWWRVHRSRITVVAWYGVGPLHVRDRT